MEMIEVNQTQRWMIDALLLLMDSKNYNDITILQITDKAKLGRRTFYRYFKSKDDVLRLYCEIILQEFGKKIMGKDEISLYTVTLSYFEFWTDYTDFLHLLKKAHMLSFLEERLESLVSNLVVRMGHVPPDLPYDQSVLYEFIFKIAGYWRVTIEWSSHFPRESPEEMAEIVANILLLGNKQGDTTI